jgi:hypothetical protein
MNEPTKQFNREEIFKAVDESNRRFENYTPEQRKAFREEFRKTRNESTKCTGPSTP